MSGDHFENRSKRADPISLQIPSVIFYIPFFFQLETDSAEVKSDSPWILSTCKCNNQQDSMDSLDKAEAERCNSVAGNHRCIWHTINNAESLYYDSIDTALNSNLYQQNGEDMADIDSLEKQFSNTSSKC